VLRLSLPLQLLPLSLDLLSLDHELMVADNPSINILAMIRLDRLILGLHHIKEFVYFRLLVHVYLGLEGYRPWVLGFLFHGEDVIDHT
jgi:hypothetical protein